MTHQTMQAPNTEEAVKVMARNYKDLVRAYVDVYEPNHTAKMALNDLHAEARWSSPFDEMPFPDAEPVEGVDSVNVGGVVKTPDGSGVVESVDGEYVRVSVPKAGRTVRYKVGDLL
jgi:hypothetical protein